MKPIHKKWIKEFLVGLIFCILLIAVGWVILAPTTAQVVFICAVVAFIARFVGIIIYDIFKVTNKLRKRKRKRKKK